MIKFNESLAPDFNLFLKLNEASSLDKLGLPREMVATIHQKEEHWEQYNRRGHMYTGGTAKGLEYKYHKPSHDVKVEDPIILTGKKSNISPYTGKQIRSEYTDFSWFLDSLESVTSLPDDRESDETTRGSNFNYSRRPPNNKKLGKQMRILFVNEEHQLYMYLYNKAKSKGATGTQYAIINWDPVSKKAIDHGFSELTTRGVDKSQIRRAHDSKGGNTNMKVQEYIKSVTQVDGRRDYSPSPNSPISVYRISVDESGITEPREIRKGRESAALLSKDVLRVFAKQYLSILPKLKPAKLDDLKSKIESVNSYSSKEQPIEISELATALGIDNTKSTAPSKVYTYLFDNFLNFRKEIFEEGRQRMKDSSSAYPKTSGFDLEAENNWASNTLGYNVKKYSISKKAFSPDEEEKSKEELADLEADPTREAQPEKLKRTLPVAGEYASIKGMVAKHALDGMFGKFAWFLLTGKIKFADASLASMMGISTKDVESDNDGEENDSWLY